MRNDELTDMMNGAIGRLVKNATRIALSDFSAVPALSPSRQKCPFDPASFFLDRN